MQSFIPLSRYCHYTAVFFIKNSIPLPTVDYDKIYFACKKVSLFGTRCQILIMVRKIPAAESRILKI